MDLFSSIEPPKPTRIGQSNGEFLAQVAAMSPFLRQSIKPADFPHATPSFVIANRSFHGGRDD